MKKSQANKIAVRIYDSIRWRLGELADKSLKHNITDAYFLAFRIGLLADIESVLLKVRSLE
jgi:hypothetical protein